MAEKEFPLAFRGYQKEDVDQYLEEVLNELSLTKMQNKRSFEESTALRNEISNLRQKLKASTNMGYADLGSQFEQTLRMAEEQAKKLIQDAGQEAIKIRDTARAEGEAAIRKSEKLAAKMLSEAESRVAELKLESVNIDGLNANKLKQAESQAAEIVMRGQQDAAVIIANAQESAAQAKSSVLLELDKLRAEMTDLRLGGEENVRLSQAEAQRILESANNVLADANAEVARIRAELAGMRAEAEGELQETRNQISEATSELETRRRRADQERIAFDLELAEARANAEREAAEIVQAAIDQAAEINRRAEETLVEMTERGQMISAQATLTLREAENQATDLIESSQRNAFHLINESRRRSEQLTRKAESFTINAIRESEERLGRMQLEYEDLTEFLDSLKSMMATEAVVSILESNAVELANQEEALLKAERSQQLGSDHSGDDSEDDAVENITKELENDNK